MEIKDFFITPVFIIIVYALAFFIRPFVTEKSNKRYFIPGLTLKIFGAWLLVLSISSTMVVAIHSPILIWGASIFGKLLKTARCWRSN
jgi:hypothetical protein